MISGTRRAPVSVIHAGAVRLGFEVTDTREHTHGLARGKRRPSSVRRRPDETAPAPVPDDKVRVRSTAATLQLHETELVPRVRMAPARDLPATGVEVRVSGDPIFRDDLYRGTAADYDRFRRPYPPPLIEDLCRRASVSGRGRLLDLACGPGTVTFALHARFADVLAVDQEPEAIDFAARKAARLGAGNIRWTTGRAEDVDPDDSFELVTIGTAFHRLDRRRVADLASRWLRSGGHLALLWSGTPINGPEPWQQALAAIVVDWMQRVGADDRLPADLEEHLARHPHAAVLEEAAFVAVQRHEFSAIHDWSIADLIGLFYSTSLLSREVLADRSRAFEDDVRDRLQAIEPSGMFREHASFAYDLAYRSPES